ncbi:PLASMODESMATA CALLOSE-BINDING PROTEIN 3-like [Papaver somniferum]|uniref:PLASMODESMATA CALLOSE-BINDING PROTEIN 3-like n=1 Tax=Papaver somniferum TaxID=3469 RepID=UPI000E6F58AA|nr:PLASMODESMATA CALLOSE-BINDING PROTEIN 3-like [Papaver somniferum]
MYINFQFQVLMENKRAYKFFLLLICNLTLCYSGSLVGGYSYNVRTKVSITSATDLKTNPSTAPFTTPITNPATTYPVPPAGSIPVAMPIATPYTTPSANPVTSNAPPGLDSLEQIWCVARTGLVESALQSALDYVCGIPGADCSAIEQNGTCYYPNSLQHHASYAFNNYYHEYQSPSSCDFGGTAIIVNRNPSTGSCVCPSSSSLAATTPSSSSSSSSVLNTGSPATTDAPISEFRPSPYSSSMSDSALLKPLFPTIVLLTSLFTTKLTRNM